MKLNVQQALVKQDNPTPAHGPLGSGLRPCKVYQREKVQRGAGASLSPTPAPSWEPRVRKAPALLSVGFRGKNQARGCPGHLLS